MPLSTFLNTSPVMQLRGAAWLALSDTGQVGAGTIVDDGGGGVTTGWAYGGSVPCRIDPLTDNETIAAGRISDRSTHLVTVPPGTAVTTSSRFLIANRGTYEVTGVQDRTGELLRFFEVVQVT
jgi:head-tail adaptor